MTTSAADCAALVPADWREPVPGAALPPAAASIGDWVVFADAQTGRLDQANARTRDTLAIIAACEARHAAALERARRRGFFTRLGL